MTVDEFNYKYADYLERGHYGLDIEDPRVIQYLDELFAEMIEIPYFTYSQIKLKFGKARVYMEPDHIDTESIENNINLIIGNGN